MAHPRGRLTFGESYVFAGLQWCPRVIATGEPGGGSGFCLRMPEAFDYGVDGFAGTLRKGVSVGALLPVGFRRSPFRVWYPGRNGDGRSFFGER